MKQTPGKFAIVALLLNVIFAAGCGGGGKAIIKPRPWSVSITKQTPAAVEVDLIGVTDLEKPAWEGYSISKYWMPGDPRRANADKITVDLPTGKEWRVEQDNPQWKKWLDRGVTYLLII